MKAHFPLFLRILCWFFLNLLILIAGLAIMVHVQFGSLRNWLLPESAQMQIQAMTQALTEDMSRSDRGEWKVELARLSAAYKMNFALFDRNGHWVTGVDLNPPPEVRQAMTYANQRLPSPPAQPVPGMPPPPWQGPGQGLGPPPEQPPLPNAGPQANRGLGEPPPGNIPDFPKSVLKTEHPSAFWLLVRLPPERLPWPDLVPMTLVGQTPSLGISPLLFNPTPWLGVAGVVILFSILFWFPLARNLTQSITKMTRATESIAEGRFDIQLQETRRDELGRLSHAINRMTARLKDYVTGQKRFLGDAAHEICSPLARMEIALGILEEKCDEATRYCVRDVREEVTHLQQIANELLNFSKASLGESHVKLGSVNVAEVAAAAIRLEKNDVEALEVEIPQELNVLADAELLRRALANLLRNAVRYAGNAGTITLSAWHEGVYVIILIADHGPGVPAGEIDKLFNPFYRVDPSRTSETGGVGLGLAIVKSCVEACGGVVSAANRVPNGLEIRIRLNSVE
ncbi:MAG: HAMP domain-containing histidine kinase [Methylacidiphilales bacterium]|nr:HAMP domain-containing histidine kinase [Candidatus Methylacidiphilales bacterium]